MTTNYFTGLIIDEAHATHLFNLNAVIRSAIGSDGCGELPEDIADLFYTAPFVMLDTKETRVIVAEVA